MRRLYYTIKELILDFLIAKQRLNGVYENSESINGSTAVQSTAYPILKTVLKNTSLNKDDTIIDIGCGMGRTLGYFNLKGFKNLIGIEIDPTYASFCSFIFKNKPNITILNIDATKPNSQGNNTTNTSNTAKANHTNSIYTDSCVLYLYNPFNQEVLEKFLKVARGKMLIYVNDVHKQTIIQNKNWRLQKTFYSHLNDGTKVSISVFLFNK